MWDALLVAIRLLNNFFKLRAFLRLLLTKSETSFISRIYSFIKVSKNFISHNPSLFLCPQFPLSKILISFVFSLESFVGVFKDSLNYYSFYYSF